MTASCRPLHVLLFMTLIADRFLRVDVQNMEYKFVELLSATFVRSNDETVRQQITYRYNAMKVTPPPASSGCSCSDSLSHTHNTDAAGAVSACNNASSTSRCQQLGQSQEPIATASGNRTATQYPLLSLLCVTCTHISLHLPWICVRPVIISFKSRQRAKVASESG